jgi:DNA polymerase-3 subunit epsilon
MRQVVLDTETTGLEIAKGHRIIEIGCVELINRRATGNTYHKRVRPDRDIDPAAEEVHGISLEMLKDKPPFAEIAEDFVSFISGAELVIHNADFDVGFLDHEFRLAGLASTDVAGCCEIVDTLQMARQMHPGQRNSLDALCKRYSVDNSGRDFHGALLDAQLLADVYLAMTGGQGTLTLNHGEGAGASSNSGFGRINRANLRLAVVRPTAAELAAHEQQLDLIDKASSSGALWRKQDA